MTMSAGTVRREVLSSPIGKIEIFLLLLQYSWNKLPSRPGVLPRADPTICINPESLSGPAPHRLEELDYKVHKACPSLYFSGNIDQMSFITVAFQ